MDPVGALGFSASLPALLGPGSSLNTAWWQRAPLNAFCALPPGPAVYAIHEPGSGEPVYVGETSALPGRAARHAAGSWPLREPTIAFMPLLAGTPKHVLRELGSDLLGWHFSVAGRAPTLQYAESARKGTAA